MADRRRWFAVVLASALAGGLLSGCGATSDAGGEHQMTGTLLDPPFAVAGDALVDGSRAPYSLVEDTDKQLTLVFFGYTHCPDICGIVMSTMASAMTRLSDEERAEVDVVFVTTDPTRDTPEVTADYATNFDPGFIGVTGPIRTIIDVAKPLGISVDRGEKLPSGGFDVAHGTQIVAIDAADDGIAYWSEDVSSAQLAADLQHLLSE
ncbi:MULTISPECIES: SCO family protein [Nocardioides]|uniref:SCO family protein n=1 Tax=Nocardioides TaxID=1839 RepID=UPI000331051F|nr:MULTISPECIES: SCO family protein [Nocardioides]EON23551.1 electron transport protein SCO1/SenC [Nocardioides sp. CF8]